MEEIGEKILRRIRVGKVLGKIPPECILLDVGCGSSFSLLKQVKDKIREGYGLDKSAPTGDVGNIHLTGHFIKDKLPFENDFFDMIVSLAVFEHLDYPAQIVSEFYRILKDGGRIVITLPSPRADFLYKKFLLPLHLVNLESVSEHKYYSPGRLREFFLMNKFKDININTFELGFNFCIEARK